LIQLKLAKERIKELLSKSELTTLHCHGLRDAYEAIHNEKVELVFRQLSYYSISYLLKTIPDIQ